MRTRIVCKHIPEQGPPNFSHELLCIACNTNNLLHPNSNPNPNSNPKDEINILSLFLAEK